MTNMKSKNTEIRSGFGPMPLSSQLSVLAKKLLGKRGFSNTDLLLHWNDVIGSDLSKFVKPDKITYSQSKTGGAVLHVRVGTGSFAVVVEHQKKILLQRINTFLGYDAIRDIKIRQDLIELPAPSKKAQAKNLTPEQEAILQEKLANIQDENMKEKLYEIGKAIFLK